MIDSRFRIRPIITVPPTSKSATISLRAVVAAGHYYEGACFELQGDEAGTSWSFVQFVQSAANKFALVSLRDGNRIWDCSIGIRDYVLLPVQVEMTYTRAEG